MTSARSRLSGRVRFIFDALLRIVTAQLLQITRQLVVDVRAAIEQELLERTLTRPGPHGRLLLRCLRVTVEWRVGDGEMRRRGALAVKVCGPIKVSLELGTRRSVVFDFGKHPAETTGRFWSLELLVLDVHVGWKGVEETPVAVEILRQAVALAIPLFGEQAVRGLDVLNGKS